MTVTSLTSIQKASIVTGFGNKLTITELGEMFERSNRTIVRVLEEAGVDPGIKRRPRVKKPTPLPTVIPTKTPWWSRVIEKVKDISQRRFSA